MPKPDRQSAQQILDLKSMLLTPDARTIEVVTVLLDHDVVERYKAFGPDWKTRMQMVLEQTPV